MKSWARLCSFAIACVLLTVLAAAAACGGSSQPKFPVAAGAGPMPADQSWQGVYYNPVYGNLNLIEKDGNIVGRWRRTDSSHWGELNGAVEGNLLRFTWKEHKYNTVGPSADSHGTGVFVYKVPASAEAAELDGQYALDDTDSVGTWHCVKQNNVKPDLDSINGTSPESPVPHETWQ